LLRDVGPHWEFEAGAAIGYAVRARSLNQEERMPTQSAVSLSYAESANHAAPVSLEAPSTRFAALINISASGANAARQRRLAAHIRDTLGSACVNIVYADGKGLARVLRELSKSEPDVVIAVGGDGTARTALETLTPRGIATAPLPVGTLNRLSRLVYGKRSARAIISGLAQGKARWIPGGTVAGRKFFVASGYGAPMRLNLVREYLRHRAFGRAWRAWTDVAPSVFGPALVEVSGLRRAGSAVVIGVGPVESAFGLRAPAAATQLEAASIRWSGAGGALAAGLALVAGAGRRAPSIAWAQGREFTLHSSESAIDALLDGERVLLPARSVVHYNARCGLVWGVAGT
jgi:diacylglycerol kinase family enzyme